MSLRGSEGRSPEWAPGGQSDREPGPAGGRANERVRVVCVSLGHRGRQWVEWARAAGAEVVGVVDLLPELLETVGAELGFGSDRRFTSVPAALAALHPDAVIVCTPNETHAALAREVLGAGVHLLVEKPLAEDWDEAVAMVTLAREKGLQLAVAQQYRYRSGFPALKEAIAAGKIGSLTGGLVQFYRWRPTQGMKLPLLLNQAIHHFDVMRFLVGADPTAVTAHLWDPAWNGASGPTCAEATFLFPGDVRVHYSGSYVARGSRTSFNGLWRLEGSKGQLVLDEDENVVLHRDGRAHALFRKEQGERHPEVRLCQDFLRSVESGRPCPTHGEDNLRTLAMVFAVEMSARLGRTVALSELLPTEPRQTESRASR